MCSRPGCTRPIKYRGFCSTHHGEAERAEHAFNRVDLTKYFSNDMDLSEMMLALAELCEQENLDLSEILGRTE